MTDTLPAAPDGWHAVTPRIVVEDAKQLVAFVKDVFGAAGEYHESRPAEILIGDSVVMISDAGPRDAMPAFLYVYVPDVDEVYSKAMEAGAAVIEKPFDTPYGDRRATVKDIWGNLWQIASRK